MDLSYPTRFTRNQARLVLACLTLCAAGCAGGDPALDEDPTATDVATDVESLIAGAAPLKVSAISASTSEAGNGPANAVDGSLGTRWSGYGVGAYLTVDLGTTRNLDAVSIAWYLGKSRRSTFAVATSLDNKVYKTVYTGTSSGTRDTLESYDVPDLRVRYVRLIVNGNSENAWASVTELQVVGTPDTSGSTAAPLFSDSFSGTDGLITNEYAYWNPTRTGIYTSPNWDMNSGSLFRKSSSGWTGIPDGTGPNISSSTATDSSVFRMMSKRSDFQDVAVTFQLKNNGLVTTSRTPAVDWDGVHVWIRYQSEESIYYATVNRRDNVVLIKKKVPGGPSNGGTYYTISSTVAHTVPYGVWQAIKVSAKNNADGSVTIKLAINGQDVVSAIDTGIGGPPIRAAGKVGIRGDNCNFNFDDFQVSAL